MKDPGVTTGGPGGRRLASGSQPGFARQVCAVSRALVPARPDAACATGQARPASTAAPPPRIRPPRSRPRRGSRRRFTGTPRADGKRPTRIRRHQQRQHDHPRLQPGERVAAPLRGGPERRLVGRDRAGQVGVEAREVATGVDWVRADRTPHRDRVLAAVVQERTCRWAVNQLGAALSAEAASTPPRLPRAASAATVSSVPCPGPSRLCSDRKSCWNESSPPRSIRVRLSSACACSAAMSARAMASTGADPWSRAAIRWVRATANAVTSQTSEMIPAMDAASNAGLSIPPGPPRQPALARDQRQRHDQGNDNGRVRQTGRPPVSAASCAFSCA